MANGVFDDENHLLNESVEMQRFAADFADTIDTDAYTQATLSAHQQILSGLIRAAEPFVEGQARIFGSTLEPGGSLLEQNVIVGAGLGIAGPGTGLPPGEGALQLYTSEPVSREVAISNAISAFGAEALSNQDTYVEVIHTGPIDALAHRMHMRPSPGGISVGHYAITAGTLGCLARGRSSPRDERVLILSNNHVLADVNAGSAGDAVIQPGAADGGKNPADQIAALERYVPIAFPGPNLVDCATAWVDESMVRSELMYLDSANQVSYFNLSSGSVLPRAGMAVGKSGRTSQLTSGTISAIAVTINVNMGLGRVATFTDQVSVVGSSGQFSDGGDSGSLIWTWDKPHHPVALLFAGGGGYTFGNPIDAVLNSLDIDLIT